MAKSLTQILGIGALTASALTSCASVFEQGKPPRYDTNTGSIGPSTQVINPRYEVDLLRTNGEEYLITRNEHSFELPNGNVVTGVGIADVNESTIYRTHSAETVEVVPNYWSVITDVDAENGSFVLGSQNNPRRESVDFKGITHPLRSVEQGFGLASLTHEDINRKGYDTVNLNESNFYVTSTKVPLRGNSTDPASNLTHEGLVFYNQSGTREFTSLKDGRTGLEGYAKLAVKANIVEPVAPVVPAPEDIPESTAPRSSDE